MSRGKLLEVVDGIPIYAKAQPDPLALVEGRRGRLEAGGPVFQVHRVGTGAAYLFKVYDPPVMRTIGDAATTADAADALAAVMARKGVDVEVIVKAAVRAAHAANQIHRIMVSRGPVEPGISTAARFVERVS